MRGVVVAAILVSLPCVGAVIAYGTLSHTKGKTIPRVQVTPRVVDLGRLDVLPGASIKGKFHVANHGTATLNIRRLSASCGCTVPQIPIPKLLPGEQATVDLQVKPRNKSGLQESVVTLITNDPATPSVEVRVTWYEEIAIDTEPKSLDFDWLPSGKADETKVRVRLSKRLDRNRLEVECGNPCVSFTWLEKPANAANDDSSYQDETLLIRVEPGTDGGPQSAELRITSGDGQCFSRLPILWKSGPWIDVSPKAIFRFDVPTDTQVESQLLVRSADGKAVTVLTLKVDGQPSVFTTKVIRADGILQSVVAFGIRTGKAAGVENHSVSLAFADGLDTMSVPVSFVLHQR